MAAAQAAPPKPAKKRRKRRRPSCNAEPFGGIGSSGIGSYHGQKSFETFSHQKSMLKRPFWFDAPLRYPPYGNKLKILEKIMR